MAVNLLALLLAGLGVVLGPVISNIYIVAGLTVTATLVKGFIDLRRYDAKVEMSRFAYTTYAKALTEFKAFEIDNDRAGLVSSTLRLHTLHKAIIDLTPFVPDKYKKRYNNQEDVTNYVDSGNLNNLYVAQV